MSLTQVNLSDSARALFDSLELVATVQATDRSAFQDLRQQFASKLVQSNKTEWQLRIRGKDAATILAMAAALAGLFEFQGRKLPP